MTLMLVDFKNSLSFVNAFELVETILSESFEAKLPSKWGSNLPKLNDEKISNADGKYWAGFIGPNNLGFLTLIEHDGNIGFATGDVNNIDSLSLENKKQLKMNPAAVVRQMNYVLGLIFVINKTLKFKTLHFTGENASQQGLYEKVFNTDNFVKVCERNGYTTGRDGKRFLLIRS